MHEKPKKRCTLLREAEGKNFQQRGCSKPHSLIVKPCFDHSERV